MSTATDLKKSELLDRATELAVARKGSGGPPSGEVGALLTAYYRHVAPDDVAERTEVDLYGALASQFRLADNRPQGTRQRPGLHPEPSPSTAGRPAATPSSRSSPTTCRSSSTR